MDNVSRSQSYNTLSKQEIIRGYNTYLQILQKSKLFTTVFIKAFVNSQSQNFTIGDHSLRESPLITNNVKVGFIIAKKKIKKAVLRNRIKRLLKESYRLNKEQLITFRNKTNIIYSLTDQGYEHFKNYPETKLSVIISEMFELNNKILKHLVQK